MTDKTIGLSLSFCVKDLLTGRAPCTEETLTKIVCGCRPETLEHLEEVIQSYQRVYWTDFPERAAEMARRLWNAGKLEFPGLKTPKRTPQINQGCWVSSEEEITWFEYRA